MNEKRDIKANPREQIRFLERSLGQREWRSNIAMPDDARDAALLRRELVARGYMVREKVGKDGERILAIHHLGRSPDMAGLYREYGALSGTGYAITHPLVASSQLLDGTRQWAGKAGEQIKDPARANGLIYVLAEAFLFMGAGGNPHGKWYHPKNFLQGVSASFFLSQSLAYLGWAKKGDDRIVHDLGKQLKQMPAGTPEQLSEAPLLNERPTNSLLGHARRALEDHPIETGAMFNNAGMAAYIGHSILERQHRMNLPVKTAADLSYIKRGFWWGLFGSAISIAGWSSLLLKPKEYDEPAGSVLGSWYQKWRENPQSLAAATTLISSGSRLNDAIIKGNTYQAIGEGIYIPGDILLFFVKNHEYGASTQQNLQGLAEKVAPVLQQQPVLLDKEAQQRFFDASATYLVRQVKALSDQEESAAEQTAEDIKAVSDILQTNCETVLQERYDVMIAAAQALVSAFPADEHKALSQHLATVIGGCDGVSINESAFADAVEKHQLPAAKERPELKILAQSVGRLALALPAPGLGTHALKLHDALNGYLNQPKRDAAERPNSQIIANGSRVSSQKSDAMALLAY